MPQARFDFIDQAKAIGIVLVILGHAPGIPAGLVTWIYSFHMPLFFFLSGFLLNQRKLAMAPGAYLGQLLRTLGLPYLLFFAASYAYWLATRHLGARAAKFAGVSWQDPLFGWLSGIGSEIIVNVTLWFFPCLITTAFLYHLARKAMGASAALLVCAVLGGLDAGYAGHLPARLPWGLDNAWAALAFYAFGQWLRVRPLALDGPARLPLAAGALLSAALSALLADLNGRVDLNYANFGTYPVLYFPTALGGIAAVLGTASLMPSNGLSTWLARHTLLLFPSHTIVINFLSGLGKLVFRLPESFFTTPWFGLIGLAGAIAACLPLAYLVRQTAHLGRLRWARSAP
ncbi:acyltransferase family protein [Candidatus Methylocalor cossyra]|uniref:Acyl_transf_3 domain-containing protein n=1 Tax=Candidatus Methylocalor cossyra TaxID=3108543 RepID=A0ABM9NJS0_9GAMM